MSATEAVPAPRLRWRQLRRSTRALLVVLFVLLVGGCLEVATRCYWAAVQKVPPRREGIWRSFFPEMDASGIDRVAPYHADGTFDVLILGPSVLHPAFGDIGKRLGAGLEKRLGRPVRIVNLAYPGRTSRDSRIKYERLGDRRFDLVIVYHGINDVFLNDCPPGSFRPDYTHATRFAQLAALDGHAEVGWLTLPYTAYYIGSNLLSRWHCTNNPRDSFAHYGSDIRTPPSFEDNLEAIARTAKERGDPLLLMTFAYYLPSDYTEEASDAKALDYADHVTPVSAWGEPANVVRTLDLHNDAVRRVAARHGLPLVEQRQLMPDGKRYYHDLCHLTPEGCARFADHILERLDLRKVGRHGGR